MTTEIITAPDVDLESWVTPFADIDENDGEDRQFAHVVNPPLNTHIWQPGMKATEIVSIARAQGIQVTALCGKKWVPKVDPGPLPACERCMEIAASIISEAG